MANFQDLNSREFDDEFANIRSLYNEAYVDDDYSGDESEDFLSDIARTASSVLTGGINAAANTGRRIASGVGTILGVNPTPVSTSGINRTSNLSATIQSPSGQRMPLSLPSNVATKQDIEILQKAVSKINGEIKAVADANNVNAKAMTKLTSEVQSVESRRLQAQKSTSVTLGKMGSALSKARNDLRKMREQNQMQMMLSMFMQPSYKVTLTTADIASIAQNNSVELEAKSSGDDNTFLMMAMMGGFGGNGGGSDSEDGGMNPMMMYLMADGAK